MHKNYVRNMDKVFIKTDSKVALFFISFMVILVYIVQKIMNSYVYKF